MKKVIHIINAMQIGGVEVGVLSLLKSKLNRDYRVITIKGCDEQLYDSLTADEQSRLHICDGYFSAISLLFKLKPKMIVSSLWRAHLVSLFFKLLKPRTKRVHFVHSARYAHFVDQIVTRKSVFLSDFVLCDSKVSQNWLNEETGYRSPFVVPMNVSFSNEKKNTVVDPLSFVFVGRFCKSKNLLQSLEFIKLLNASRLTVTFDLYGRNDGELDSLIEYVEQYKLTDIVKFHSSLLPTIIEHEMRKYNYYLQTSPAEGMAISVYQAIKNGLLPVVTPVGEIQRYTSNGVNAFHLDASDISGSVRDFEETIISGKIHEFDIGCILNETDYPEFDKSYFSAIDNCKNKK